MRTTTHAGDIGQRHFPLGGLSFSPHAPPDQQEYTGLRHDVKNTGIKSHNGG